MKKHCEEGKILCEKFEDKLRVWGFAELNREAAERIVGGSVNPNLNELSQHAKEAHSAFLKAKHAYLVHVADCLVCSRKLLAPA
jgi:hypothetical protein